MLGRLRAALTPQALLLLGALLLLLTLAASGGAKNDTTALERRVSQTLSSVEGAGRVRVVIQTRKSEQGSGIMSAQPQEVPSGAVAVAEGADDPLVNLRLTQALCSLLGLPASAVTVMSGSGGM